MCAGNCGSLPGTPSVTYRCLTPSWSVVEALTSFLGFVGRRALAHFPRHVKAPGGLAVCARGKAYREVLCMCVTQRVPDVRLVSRCPGLAGCQLCLLRISCLVCGGVPCVPTHDHTMVFRWMTRVDGWWGRIQGRSQSHTNAHTQAARLAPLQSEPVKHLRAPELSGPLPPPPSAYRLLS